MYAFSFYFLNKKTYNNKEKEKVEQMDGDKKFAISLKGACINIESKKDYSL